MKVNKSEQAQNLVGLKDLIGAQNLVGDTWQSVIGDTLRDFGRSDVAGHISTDQRPRENAEQILGTCQFLCATWDAT